MNSFNFFEITYSNAKKKVAMRTMEVATICRLTEFLSLFYKRDPKKIGHFFITGPIF